MPRPFWTHDCCTSSPVIKSMPNCPECGRRGTFWAWYPGMYEAMAIYARKYGLKPNGSHRVLADSLFRKLRIQCAHCGGAGIVGNEAGYAQCKHCEGGGGIWTASDDEIRGAYRRILHEHPDAAGPHSAIPDIWRSSPPLRRRSARNCAPRSAPQPGTRIELRLDDVQRAFMEAERRLGKKWKLKGRGHCPRATLKNRYARFVHRVTSCWERLTPQMTGNPRVLYPVAIIAEAARILGVEVSELMGREY